ncbi:MAG: aminotransferase class I/II-fold pyridoxal phosphate-dependent enzyme [Prolixibacteraceae bacterium]|nr:aminotransferase class I/II-fold pyridoxal phosphate-dependent enzyme [Prolixibacteraceae bacterium]MBT6764931.1 aminotransferase class I/II-fold pyridoxal phosphate-dependent enzyme [Prolixibacteraceae bacterium]MBT6997415.1 aminotransferase class I/II-fold pyridoxal phosphate-dependent enzyme [Prolixibacteraceae bacterium]MBT7396626.1 aminotransferase class I/II-fold pyridoxal phosphate-dependent enzyme [Prolixibacteraceae bacterium]
MDIFAKFRTNQGDIGKYMKQAHGYFAFPKLEGEISAKMNFRGKEVLTWSLNNYLGLGNHPEVRKTDADAAAQYGMAYPMGARMMSGQTARHEELERELASFVGKKDAFLLNYGYQGMVSIIDAVCGRNDVIVYDSESHACILDGVRLHMGKRYVYPHNNMENLRKQLERATKLAEKQKGGIFVITEGVFGMSGDLGKLDEIVKLKEEFEFRLLVDDAHGFGVMGKTGAGAPEFFGVQDGVDLHFGTFAKAMAGIGGFVAGETDICYYLRYNMRSQTYAKALPMTMVIGALKRLKMLRTMPEFKEKLWTIVNALQKGLKEAGFDLGKTNSPVTPVYMKGGEIEAANLVYDLRENHGIFCSIVVYPVIPRGEIILRLIPTAMHSIEDVELTLKAFKVVRKKLENGKYSKTEMAHVQVDM